MKLREEISARESLQDFCFVLAERVGDLEREVQRQAETIALLTKGEPVRAPPRRTWGSSVSMHGSSAPSRGSTMKLALAPAAG